MAKTNPTISIALLSGIGEAKLKDKLTPLKSDLEKSGLWWTRPEEFNPRGLALFLRNIFQLPKEVADPLYVIGTLAKNEYESFVMDEFLDAKIEVPNGNIKAAMTLWERSPEICASIIVRQDALRHRKYAYFRPKDKVENQLKCPTQAEVEVIRKDLSEWFNSKGKGKYSLVLCHEEEDWIYFSIFHGGSIKHDNDVNSGDVNPLSYRPEISDFVRVNKMSGVLGIHLSARCKLIETHYVEVVRKFFLQKNKYISRNCYTLEPLKDERKTLIVGDLMDTISKFRLKEVHLQFKGQEIRIAGDNVGKLWVDWKLSQSNFKKAIFEVYFMNDDNPKTLTIIPPNTIDYPERYDSEDLNELLAENKFLIEEEVVVEDTAKEDLQGTLLDFFDVAEPVKMAN